MTPPLSMKQIRKARKADAEKRFYLENYPWEELRFEDPERIGKVLSDLRDEFKRYHVYFPLDDIRPAHELLAVLSEDEITEMNRRSEARRAESEAALALQRKRGRGPLSVKQNRLADQERRRQDMEAEEREDLEMALTSHERWLKVTEDS